MNATPKLNAHLWVEKYSDYLYNFAYQRINDRDKAHDLVQDTFLSALEKADNFEGNCSEMTWLRTILNNKIIDVYRRNASGLNTVRIDNEIRQDDDFFEQSGVWSPNHLPTYFDMEEYEELNVPHFYKVLEYCVEKLPALWLSTFKLKYMEHKESASICESLRLSSSNYWVILHRTKLNLRECFQNKWN
jgi:RNA polymerase sigma-70 factor (TIGR02943 family)